MIAAEYNETQQFRRKILWVIIVFITFFFIAGTFQQIAYGIPFGDDYRSDLFMLAGSGILLTLALMFFFIRFEIKINDRGIYYRFYPFQVLEKFISWEKVRNACIRDIETTKELMPVGIKLGPEIQTYNLKGSHILQLELENGKRVFLGTENPKKLRSVLVDYGKSI